MIEVTVCNNDAIHQFFRTVVVLRRFLFLKLFPVVCGLLISYNASIV